ncbi:MAG: 5-(carboxyamino)imidazole ribonucleotide mutase [Candidatus Glassbacteria bacterium]
MRNDKDVKVSDRPRVLIVMGSESDRSVVKAATEVLDEAGVSYECVVSSAHRNPDETADLAKDASRRGIRVIIAAAGLSAALPGFLSAHTRLPIIGVPVSAGPLKGIDALLSMVQMPSGIPVGVVGIDGAKNAAHFALRILNIY